MSNVTNSLNSSLSSLTGDSKYLGTGGGSIVSMLLKEMNSSSTKGTEFSRSGPIGDFDNKLKIVYLLKNRCPILSMCSSSLRHDI